MEATFAGREELSGSLENYLKAVSMRAQTDGVVRVRDLSRDLDVKAPSVTAALKRLAHLGLVVYVQREYVRLTAAGEERARRIQARHTVLNWFFQEVLRLPGKEAGANACSMEHVLSAGAMDRLVSLFEFVRACPSGREAFLERFHHCPVFAKGAPPCGLPCSLAAGEPPAPNEKGATTRLSQVKPGGSGKVLRVDGSGELRHRLIEMGLLPDQILTVERTGPRGNPLWIRLAGFQLALRKAEAELVVVAVEAD
jgi:DtxR family transcriptional regulator, Mn-dependent transcriptional regulator